MKRPSLHVRGRGPRALALLGALVLGLPLGAGAAAEPATALTGTVDLSVPGLTATLATDFPQVTGYEVGGSHLGGRVSTVTSVLVDDTAHQVTDVKAYRTTPTAVRYDVTLDGGVDLTAEISVDTVTSQADGTAGAIRPTLTFRWRSPGSPWCRSPPTTPAPPLPPPPRAWPGAPPPTTPGPGSRTPTAP